MNSAQTQIENVQASQPARTTNIALTLLQWLLVVAIQAYRLLLGPFIGGACRFEPSCSDYAEGALRKHGALKGSLLALKRLGKCHPWGPFGPDPIP
jgi:putative membrane protein insertion efficiency factor